MISAAVARSLAPSLASTVYMKISPRPVEIGPIASSIARRQLVLDLLDALVDELAREVDVGAVLEHDGHLAQAVARERARVLELRQAAHRGLDRKGDALLDFQWRVARARVVLICTWTLVMSGTASIGRRVKFHAPKAAIAEHDQQHQPALPDRQGEDADHPARKAASNHAHRPPPPCPISALTTKLFLPA